MSVPAAVGLAGAMMAAATGTALAQSRTFEVAGPFTGVDIASGLDADVTVGGAVSVTAEARDTEYLDDLRVEVRDGRLHAWIERDILDFRFGDQRRVHLHVTAPHLDFIQASGGSNVTAKGLAGELVEANASGGADLDVSAVKATNLVASGSSGSDLRLAGTCENARFDVSSGSDLKAEDLQCKNVAVSATSGSDAEVFASVSVDANASSGGDIEVRGNPGTARQNAASGGEIKIR